MPRTIPRPVDRTRSACKTTGESRTTDNVFSVDSDLVITGLEVGQIYQLSGYIITDSDAAVDLKLYFKGQTSDMIWSWRGDTTADNPLFNEATTIAAGAGVGSKRVMVVHGTLTPSAGETSIALWWAQNVSSALAATVNAGSFIRCTPV